jgi:hypothetical protein
VKCGQLLVTVVYGRLESSSRQAGVEREVTAAVEGKSEGEE